MQAIKLTGNDAFNKVIETIEKMDFVVRSGTPDKFIDSAMELKQWKVLLCIVFPTEPNINLSIMIHDKELFSFPKYMHITRVIPIDDDLEWTVKNMIYKIIQGNGKDIAIELKEKEQACTTAFSELLQLATLAESAKSL